MLFDSLYADRGEHGDAAIARLESYHLRGRGLLTGLLGAGLLAAIAWASVFSIDQVARAGGEFIASSRVQVIQSVDGGVLSALLVREGDRVDAGQVLARLDTARIGASVAEIEARLAAMQVRAARLRAEVTDRDSLVFPPGFEAFQELIDVERVLFDQRRTGLAEELRTLQVAVDLAREEASLVDRLAGSGDANQSEVLRAARELNDAQARLVNRRNGYLEEARVELADTEDDIAQTVQVLTQRRDQLDDSVLTASMAGIVKNIAVTTVGGVLRAGEELMQIVPVDDDLLLEARVSPVDIAQVREGLDATVRLDPYDYTIFGNVSGKVVYVSADTLKEDSARGEEIFYRVHVALPGKPVRSTTGRALEVMPGMTAQVDIRTGQRSVMEFLLKPITKTLSESFGER